MSITIKVDGICGSSIEEVARDMISLTKKIEVMVTTNFNGVHLCAVESNTVDVIVANYHAELHFRKKGKIAL